METNYTCQYCGKICKNANSLRNHERLCKQNPNRQEMTWLSYGGFTEYNKNLKNGLVHRKPSNQFINAEELGLEKPKISEETKKRIGNAWRGKKHTEEQKKKISKTMSKIVKENPNYSFSMGNRFKKSIYKDFHMDSSWELIFAQYLDNQNILWVKNSKGFQYNWEKQKRTYYPDFYLSDYDVYVEIKGYETDKDKAKYTAINNLIVLHGDVIQLIKQNNFNLIDLIKTFNNNLS